MSGDCPYQLTLCVLYSIFSIIRIHYSRAARHAQGHVGVRSRSLGTADARFLTALIAYEVVTFVLYVFAGRSLSWAALPLAASLRWTGLVLGAGALALFVWVHRSLGSSFSRSPDVDGRQALVIDGPYRWVRHPMYAAFYLLHLAAALLSANGLIALTWLGGLTAFVASRVDAEEAALVDAFGEAYAAYARHTGRFVPRLGARPWVQRRPVDVRITHDGDRAT
ncbi:MAG: isoprenylcysteine carboxylmethyltransferase family protein [Anaerolineae bacterium]|nr:isoprenylcysteine carboxylmethyltransferase family protein [Anaerolineae bacterium]